MMKPRQFTRTVWLLRDEYGNAPKGAGIFDTRREANEWLAANPNPELTAAPSEDR